MNTHTNSNTLLAYAEEHSNELIRQAHLANGGYSITSQGASRFVCWLSARMVPTTTAFRTFMSDLTFIQLGAPIAKS